MSEKACTLIICCIYENALGTLRFMRSTSKSLISSVDKSVMEKHDIIEKCRSVFRWRVQLLCEIEHAVS